MNEPVDRLDAALIALGVVIGFHIGQPIGRLLIHLALATLR